MSPKSCKCLGPLRDLDEWLAPYRFMWGARLHDLERHLDAMPDEVD